MTNKLNIFAIDHGNESIKTLNDCFGCGLTVHDTLPPMVDEYIEYEDKYYALSSEPQEYEMDKSTNLNYLIYTMFAMCREEAKGGIDLDRPIEVLAIGLPPRHMVQFRKKFEEYFLNAFSRGASFKYNDVKKFVTVTSVKTYAQDYAAVIAYLPRTGPDGKTKIGNEILAVYADKPFLAIDIGGQTIDRVFFDHKKPVLERSATEESGIIPMSDVIRDTILLEKGYRLTRRDIESVLRNEKNLIPQDVKELIEKEVNIWAEKIIAEARKSVPDLRVVPILFLGGGSILLKKYLEKQKGLSSAVSFINDQKANVKGYRMLAGYQVNK